MDQSTQCRETWDDHGWHIHICNDRLCNGAVHLCGQCGMFWSAATVVEHRARRDRLTRALAQQRALAREIHALRRSLGDDCR